MITKPCRRCGQAKSLDEFVRDRTKPGGFATICRACNAARNREYRAANREQARAYRAANRERRNERSRAYRAANRERLNERARATRADRRAAGLCKHCDQLAEPGRSLCAQHQAHARQRAAARHKVRALLDYTASMGFEATLTCAICFAAPGAEVDHYVSIEDGGDNSWTNLRRVCHPCNKRRPPEPDPVNILMQVASYTSPEFAEAAAAHITARLARRRAEAEHYDAVARRIADELLGH